MVRCDTCPRCKDTYPDALDADDYHFYICGMTGNIVYKEPHKIKRYSGSGYIKCGVGSCGIFDTIKDVLATMTESEKRTYFNKEKQSND